MLDFKWVKLIKLIQAAGVVATLAIMLLFGSGRQSSFYIIALVAAAVAIGVPTYLISSRHLFCPFCGFKSIISKSFLHLRRTDVFECPKCREEISFDGGAARK